MLLDPETMAKALPRMIRAGASWRPNTVLGAIGDHDVTLVDVLARSFETIADVDTVVVRTHGTGDPSLADALRDRAPQLDVHVVGDALAARWVDRAIWDGHQAARAL